MVQTIIKGTMEKDKFPEAPLEDRADIQHLIDDVLNGVLKFREAGVDIMDVVDPA